MNLFIKSHCEFSPCRQYRYTLSREWNPLGVTLAAICLNPSTADEFKDDPTVSGMVKRARAWGFSRFVMLNLFAFRSTAPSGLLTVQDPIGPDNDYWISRTSKEADRLICAWGSASPLIPSRAEAVKKLLRSNGSQLHYLKLGKTGQPWHPLYVAHAIEPTVWSEA